MSQKLKSYFEIIFDIRVAGCRQFSFQIFEYQTVKEEERN